MFLEMQLRRTTVALFASALLAGGVAVGWLGPSFLPAGGALGAEPASASPVPLGSVPNYRAIVAENRAAVVSITRESVEHQEVPEIFGGDAPFGDDSPSAMTPSSGSSASCRCCGTCRYTAWAPDSSFARMG